MTLGYVLIQNLRRNPLRTALTATAFALPMAVFVIAISIVLNLIVMSQDLARELRAAVHHRVSFTNFLPEGMRKRIEALDEGKGRLTAVCGMRWFGGRVSGEQNVVQSLAADPDTFPLVYPDIGMTPEEIEAWNRDKRACVVGAIVARQYGWQVGSKFSLTSSIPPYHELEFVCVKVMELTSRQSVMYFRRDYLEDALDSLKFGPGGCNVFWIKARDAESLLALQRDIDAAFANSPDETKTEDENAFFAGFIQAAGNIPGLMQMLAVVVVVILGLVGGNTMMMSLRERMAELAVFKAIGFQSARVFRLVLAESVLLAVSGAAIGVLPVWLILSVYPMRIPGRGPTMPLTASWEGVAGSLAIAAVIGLIAGLWPAYQAMRLKTVNALRNIGE